jgi:hypothetical protein
VDGEGLAGGRPPDDVDVVGIRQDAHEDLGEGPGSRVVLDGTERRRRDGDAMALLGGGCLGGGCGARRSGGGSGRVVRREGTILLLLFP